MSSVPVLSVGALSIGDCSMGGSAKSKSYDVRRDTGIDLYKVLAMFLVVLYHVCVHGAKTAMEDVSVTTSAWWTLDTVRSLASCCINCFALVTGYLMYGKETKWQNLARIWVQVAFSAFACALAIKVLSPVLGVKVSSRWILKPLTPVLSRSYWYVNAYIGLFFVMPFVNRLLASLDVRAHARMALTFVGVFSLVRTFAGNDIFGMNEGFSTAWLAILYVIGAYVKRSGLAKKISSRSLWGLLAAGTLWTILSGLVLCRAERRIPYDTLPLVMISFALMLLFLRTEWKGRWALFIARAAPLTFGVYLFHNAPSVKNFLMTDSFNFLYGAMNPLGALVAALGIALVIFIMCLALEWIRVKLANLLCDKIAPFMPDWRK